MYKTIRHTSRRFRNVCTRLILIDRIISPLIANLIAEYAVKIIFLVQYRCNLFFESNLQNRNRIIHEQKNRTKLKRLLSGIYILKN